MGCDVNKGMSIETMCAKDDRICHNWGEISTFSQHCVVCYSQEIVAVVLPSGWQLVSGRLYTHCIFHWISPLTCCPSFCCFPNSMKGPPQSDSEEYCLVTISKFLSTKQNLLTVLQLLSPQQLLIRAEVVWLSSIRWVVAGHHWKNSFIADYDQCNLLLSDVFLYPYRQVLYMLTK